MKKLLMLAITIILLSAMTLSLFSCYSTVKEPPFSGNDSESETETETETENEANIGTEGLEYFPLPDGSYGVKAGSALYLEEIVIPESYCGKPVTRILPNAFEGAFNLKKITIPDTVTIVDPYAFEDCVYLTATKKNSVRYLGNDENPYLVLLEASNTTISSVDIPSTTKIIYSGAFAECTKLTSVSISDNVTYIGDNAFSGCTSLERVTLGDGILQIGNGAFKDCTAIKKVKIHDLEAWCKIRFNHSTANPNYYADEFYLNDELITNLVIPDGITSIPFSCFYGCESIKTISIPDSVISIEKSAFAHCTGLESITISGSVTVIKNYVFSNCTSLKSAVIGTGVEEIYSGVFNNCSSFETIYYTGSEEQWDNIKIDIDNTVLKSATTVYNYDPS